jgi:hypothetical protein
VLFKAPLKRVQGRALADKPKFETFFNLYDFFTLSFADFLTPAFYNDGTSTEDGEKQPPCEKGE